MAKKRKTRFASMRFRKGDPSHNVLAAIQHWVKANGGELIVIGGIEIQDWHDGAGKFRVAVGCVGRAPVRMLSERPSKQGLNMAWRGRVDPMEDVIEKGLAAARIPFRRADANPRRLDFYLPTLDIYIEVKRYHTPRIAEQMERVPDIIVIQGMKAAVTFVKMIAGYAEKGNRLRPPRYDDLIEWNCNEHDLHR